MKFLKNNRAPLLFFVALTVTIAACIFLMRYYKVDRIEVVASRQNLPLIGIDNYYGKNIVFLSEEELKRSIYDNNPLLKKVSVKKIFPSKLVVTIEENQPLAYLLVDRGYFILSNEGRIIEKTKDLGSNKPIINYYQKLTYGSFQAGDKIDLKDIITALHFTEGVEGLGLPVLSIDIDGFDMIRLQLENKMILFTTEKDVRDQDYQLETLIRQFKVEGRDFKTLDLRFDKPIVTLK